MTTELPAYVSNVIQNLTKEKKCLKAKGWNFGKKPTEKLLLNYSSKGYYIPESTNITLDEVAYEASRLLSLSAPNIIEEIQVFMEWDERHLKGIMRPLRNPYYRLSTKSYRVEGKGSKVQFPWSL